MPPGYVSETFSVEPARVREIEVDWLGGSVMVVLTDDDSLSFAEVAYQDVPEEQRLSYALDGDTLKIDFWPQRPSSELVARKAAGAEHPAQPDA